MKERKLIFILYYNQLNKIESYVREEETDRCNLGRQEARTWEREKERSGKRLDQKCEEEQKGLADSLSRMHRRGSPSLQHYRHSRDAPGFEGGCSTRGMTTVHRGTMRASEKRKIGVV